jgi:hypothetical protein
MPDLVICALLELMNRQMQSYSSDSHTALRNIFRVPTITHYPNHSWSPIAPSSLWVSTVPCPNLACFPSNAILDRFPSTRAHGRVINTVPNGVNQEPKVYAMLSLRKEVSRISPHPGVRPPELDEFVHPWYVTSDGSLGPYNASQYAQTFDPHRPWTGFHEFIPSKPKQEHPEQFNTTVFFDFKGVTEEGMCGGSWKLPMLAALYEARRQAEDAFLNTLSAMGDANGEKLVAHFGPSLPFFDSSCFNDCEKWQSWLDGRDTIGYTRRYILELKAMQCWLLELKRQDDHPNKPATICNRYSGTWVGSVNTEENWVFLMNSPLPLFGLFIIERKHPLYSTAILGSLHNDEFIRMDPVLHYLPTRFPTPYDGDYPHIGFHRPINRPLEVSMHPITLPSTLSVLPPGETVEVADAVCYFHPYTTYLFNDSKIFQPEKLEPASSRQKSLRKRRDQIAKATTRPHLPPSLGGTMMVARLPFHPITAVLPPRPLHDKTEHKYVEENKSIFFYPVPVSKNQLKKFEQFYRRSYTYDLGNNNFLLTDWPWPCPNEVQQRRDYNEDIEQAYLRYDDPSDPKRVYVHREPSDAIFDWLPDITIHPPRPDPSQPRSWDDDDDNDLLDYGPHSVAATPLACQPEAGTLGSGPTLVPVVSFSVMKFITACKHDLVVSDNPGLLSHGSPIKYQPLLVADPLPTGSLSVIVAERVVTEKVRTLLTQKYPQLTFDARLMVNTWPHNCPPTPLMAHQATICVWTHWSVFDAAVIKPQLTLDTRIVKNLWSYNHVSMTHIWTQQFVVNTAVMSH